MPLGAAIEEGVVPEEQAALQQRTAAISATPSVAGEDRREERGHVSW
jgi:hypothetical protein